MDGVRLPALNAILAGCGLAYGAATRRASLTQMSSMAFDAFAGLSYVLGFGDFDPESKVLDLRCGGGSGLADRREPSRLRIRIAATS